MGQCPFLFSSPAQRPVSARASVVMVDCVDPDNIATVVLFCLLSQAKNERECHVVLVGRPCSFALSRFSPSRGKCKVPIRGPDGGEEENKMEFSLSSITQQAHEAEYFNPEHSHTILRVCSSAFQQILTDSGVKDVQNRVKFYFGGISRFAGLSQSVHDYEDLFFTHEKGRIKVMNAEQYLAIVEKIYDMEPQDRIRFRLEHANSFDAPHLHSLTELAEVLVKANDLHLVVGGPFTPLEQISKLTGNRLYDKRGCIYAMACSWKGDKNMLGDNFNIQVDWEAFRSVMLSDSFPSLRKVILPTETCKEGDWLKVTGSQFKQLGMPGVGDLVTLWTALKRGTVQPTFDLATLLPDEQVPFELVPVRLSVAEALNAPSGFRCELTQLPRGDQTTTFFAFLDSPIPGREPDGVVKWIASEIQRPQFD
eukprot:c11231_g1_i1.p1 GENE.c11231_g1_i1~~c11231_g1_i1.p1  ORF type:complete len:423 (+),score=68.77 c11231_g1_i1:86-1354(+)